MTIPYPTSEELLFSLRTLESLFINKGFDKNSLFLTKHNNRSPFNLLSKITINNTELFIETSSYDIQNLFENTLKQAEHTKKFFIISGSDNSQQYIKNWLIIQYERQNRFVCNKNFDIPFGNLEKHIESLMSNTHNLTSILNTLNTTPTSSTSIYND